MAKRMPVLLIVLLLSLGPLAQTGVSDDHGEDSGRGPLDATWVWTDSLDDTSHVYQMVGVEVNGGQAHLASGEDRGWIASSVIHPPDGCRYDLVHLDLETPGNSYVELSMLDASASPSEVGFANDTIPGFKLIRVDPSRPVILVDDIARGTYPELRIQVTMNANGSASPRLHSWSLYFAGVDEWRDEFLGSSRMLSHSGLNFTDDALEVNLSCPGFSGDWEYDPYPIIATSYGEVRLHYPNAARTGYQPYSVLSTDVLNSVAFADINRDGHLELITVQNQNSGIIYWADPSDSYSSSNKTKLTLNSTMTLTSGDYNDDGWMDLAFKAFGGAYPSVVFLNEGDGTIDDRPDVVTSYNPGGRDIHTGDVNGDGIDDLVSSKSNTETTVHYGSAEGPSADADVILPSANPICVHDLDYDGFDDVVALQDNMGHGLYIFMGDDPDIHTTADYSHDTPTGYTQFSTDCSAGDINGDGYVDIAVRSVTSSSERRILVYEGAIDGWTNSRIHTIQLSTGSSGLLVLDIDKDGYSDILYSLSDQLRIAYGGTDWPDQHDVSMNGGGLYISAALHRGGHGARTHRGYFITEPIDLPPEKRWDILDLSGTFPQDTSFTISILDGNRVPIDGYRNLGTKDVDLSDLRQGTIHARVDIFSGLNDTTPTLDRLLVNWIDQREWREQFYGTAKVDRCLSLDIEDGMLTGTGLTGTAPEIVFTSVQDEEGVAGSSTCYIGDAPPSYFLGTPLTFLVDGASSSDACDVNGDGFDDMVFSSFRTSTGGYATQSPLFLNSHVGWADAPYHVFPTTGASGVLLEDLNGDSYVDVVFAQEYDGSSYRVNSTLFWGSANGWNSTPDVEFVTCGASGVVAADLDGDHRLDVAFSCYRDQFFSTDSMVFLQTAGGFDGTTPDHLLPTKGARAVDVGDVDGDGHLDLVFANSMSGGLAEIASYVYWGKAGGGFEGSPVELPTAGASDVAVGLLDGDAIPDMVFANRNDNNGLLTVDSYVYLGTGTRALPATPSIRLPTNCAVGVAMADIDGAGWRDLVFACEHDDKTHETPSMVYLGGVAGYASSPDLELATVGAHSVLVNDLVLSRCGGYLSQEIAPEDPRDVGCFHTLRYSASVGASQSGTIQVLDAATWEVLAEGTVQQGEQTWDLGDELDIRYHPAIRIKLMVEGMDRPGEFEFDDLWINWTQRVRLPPLVLGLEPSEDHVYRTGSVELVLNISDEFDLLGEFEGRIAVQHRPSNGTGPWQTIAGGNARLEEGAWRMDFIPTVHMDTGPYDFQVRVTDSDGEDSGWVQFPGLVTVLNNLPTSPEVAMRPASPPTSSTLEVEVTVPSHDVETSGLSYVYRWYLDGALQEGLTDNTVIPTLTQKGQNWSVEVAAWDGEDESPPGRAFCVIQNSPPQVDVPLPDPELPEDTVDDRWLDLGRSFSDPDGDVLAFSVADVPEHIAVTIGADGKVTLRPEPDWFGQESATFTASDGSLSQSQTVLITVTPVNDVPWFTTVDGKPITTDPVPFDIMQGELLTITVGSQDVEGDALTFSVNTTAVTVDESTGTITFQPGLEQVGTLRFALTMREADHPEVKAVLNFTITVNAEEWPARARITSPSHGDKYNVSQTFPLIGIWEPGAVSGQILNFSWWWNGTNLIGYGSSLTCNFTRAGNYTITLNVTDGEFFSEACIVIEIVPIPPPDDHVIEPTPKPKEGFSIYLGIGILVALVIVGGVILLVMSRKRAAQKEAQDEAEEKREAFAQMAVVVKETTEQLEQEVAEARAAKPVDTAKVVIETRGPGGEVTQATAAEMGTLAMAPKETEAPSADVAKLFQEMEAKEPQVSVEEQERLRVESLKRKYQTAISRLPYGIPSEALKDKDWTWLAGALATGEKKTVSDGREVTMIEGRWYHSDVKDASSFLKEHGAKPMGKEPAVETDRTALLAKLEERFILGEIPEETYNRLVKKYSEED